MPENQNLQTPLTHPVAPEVTQALADALQQVLAGADGAVAQASQALAQFQRAAEAPPPAVSATMVAAVQDTGRKVLATMDHRMSDWAARQIAQAVLVLVPRAAGEPLAAADELADQDQPDPAPKKVRLDVHFVDELPVQLDGIPWLSEASEEHLLSMCSLQWSASGRPPMLRQMLGLYGLGAKRVKSVSLDPATTMAWLRVNRGPVWAAIICSRYGAQVMQWPTGKWLWTKTTGYINRLQLHDTPVAAAIACERELKPKATVTAG